MEENLPELPEPSSFSLDLDCNENDFPDLLSANASDVNHEDGTENKTKNCDNCEIYMKKLENAKSWKNFCVQNIVNAR